MVNQVVAEATTPTEETIITGEDKITGEVIITVKEISTIEETSTIEGAEVKVAEEATETSPIKVPQIRGQDIVTHLHLQPARLTGPGGSLVPIVDSRSAAPGRSSSSLKIIDIKVSLFLLK